MIPPSDQTWDLMRKSSTLLGRLLFRLTGHLRCRLIPGPQGEAYLERYHLFRLPGGGGAYLHRFLDSDPDRGLHDHPWRRALGIVLSGGYVEQRLVDDEVVERRLGPGRINALSGKDFHRIVLAPRHEAWTFFMHSGRVKDWGFINRTPDRTFSFTPHEQALTEGSHANWWQTAPPGRLAAREPCTGA